MSLLRTLLALYCISLSCLAWSAQTPSVSAVQSSLASLSDRALPEAEEQALKQTLENTLSFLSAQQSAQQSLEQLRQQLEAAPQQIEENRQALSALKEQPTPDIAALYGEATISEIEQALAESSNQINDWQQQIISTNADLISSQTRPDSAQKDIGADQARIQQINTALKNGRINDQNLSDETRDLLNAELAALTAKVALNRQELTGNNRLQDLSNSARALLDEQMHRAEQTRAELIALLNEKRRAESQQAVDAQFQQTRKLSSSGLIAQESAINLKLSDYLLDLTERLNSLTQENLKVLQQLDSINQTQQTLDQQISILNDKLVLSRILNQQKQALPSLQFSRKNLSGEIADLRLGQFELTQQRDAIAQPENYVDELLAGQPQEQNTPKVRQALLAQIDTRRDLLDRLNGELNALLSEAIALQINRTELTNTSQALRATLNEQLFWLPSNRPMDLQWFSEAPARITAQLQEVPLSNVYAEFKAGIFHHPWVFLPLGLLIAVLLWRRQALAAKLEQINSEVGNYRFDSQLHTPLALLFNLLLALPGTLFLLLCAYALSEDARGYNAVLSDALTQMAWAWLVFFSLYRIMARGGIAEVHFQWSQRATAFLRKNMAYLGTVVMAMVVVVSFAEHQPTKLVNDVLGVLVIIICYALITWLTLRMVLKNPDWRDLDNLRRGAAILCSLSPLVLIAALVFGYYYTALKLTAHLIETLYLLLIWLIVEASCVRALAVAARRLTYQRAQALREAEQEAAGDGENEVALEQPNLDMQQINQQSLRLLRLVLLGVALVLLYDIWAEVIGVFNYFNTITLYNYSSDTGVHPITLLDLLIALILAALTVIFARNLPGLLEVLVLSKLNLAQGSSYATTTLLSYVLIAVGVAATLSTLGVTWDKLQWLAAALSVGLGFGLQAIFANFVSGLIILFEQPIRIGDQVTVGSVSGTVKRIHIRATHLIDGDRKAVIVPNQTFITSQLINWTLLDSITRIVLIFTVNRGADLEQVRELLLQAARANPRVMSDPAPSAQLTVYGAASLTYELKVFVRELGDRSGATDELNRSVDQLFAEHGINLSSVPKMEVFLQSRDGATEKRMDSSTAE